MIEGKGPFVLVEALGLLRARGIAFEATFAGAVGDAAFLRNAAALADRLAALLSNKELRLRMGARARERHEEKYTLSIFEHNLAAARMACTRCAPTAQTAERSTSAGVEAARTRRRMP